MELVHKMNLPTSELFRIAHVSDTKHFNVDFEICDFSPFLSESLGYYPLINAMLIAVIPEDFLTKDKN